MSEVLAPEYSSNEPSPSLAWDADVARRALDELFSLARHYKTGDSYRELLRFIARFRFYSPFNAMLVHMQMPGAKFVATPNRWSRDFGRTIKPGARPIVVLQPKGPVLFVFDVSDTDGGPHAAPLPSSVDNPFEVRRGRTAGELDRTIENAKRDAIDVVHRELGSQRAGLIRFVGSGAKLEVVVRMRPAKVVTTLVAQYQLELNSKLSAPSQYATLIHELGHLYCGHLGTPNTKWWPDRRGLSHTLREFEAESVCYLVCTRAGIDNPSDEYLAGYLRDNAETPPISLDCVMKAAGLIEQMGRERLSLRKDDHA